MKKCWKLPKVNNYFIHYTIIKSIIHLLLLFDIGKNQGGLTDTKEIYFDSIFSFSKAKRRFPIRGSNFCIQSFFSTFYILTQKLRNSNEKNIYTLVRFTNDK